MSHTVTAAERDLLGLVAGGLWFAFESLARDAQLATDLRSKTALGAMAVAEYGHYEAVVRRIADTGADPGEVVGAYLPILDRFHRATAPRDLLEGLTKAYLGDALAADYALEIASHASPAVSGFIAGEVVDCGQETFIVPAVRAAVAADPHVGGRLALWGRRLMGEELALAQSLAAQRGDLAELVMGGPDTPGAGLGEYARMLTRMTDTHSARMRRLGLEP